MMTLCLNGSPREFPQATLTVTELLQELKLTYPVLAEINGEALLKRQFDSHQLQDGDQVEIIRMVAGG